MFVFMKPLAALATMNPEWPVLRSLIRVRKPAAVSLIVTWSTSPPFIFRVCAFGKNVLTSVRCGLGGPAGTPFICRNAKLTGSMQLLLHVTKPNVHDRLSIVSAAHHFVGSQLTLSMHG